jgi:hypothetical protein
MSDDFDLFTFNQESFSPIPFLLINFYSVRSIFKIIMMQLCEELVGGGIMRNYTQLQGVQSRMCHRVLAAFSYNIHILTFF